MKLESSLKDSYDLYKLEQCGQFEMGKRVKILILTFFVFPMIFNPIISHFILNN